jgi:integrase
MKLALALTDTALRRVKPRTTPYKLADGGGLFAQVMPNGSIYWRFKYSFGGKEKLLALGQYPAVKLAEARAAHQSAKIRLQSGVDPSAARQAERAEQQAAETEAGLRATTFGQIADEWLETRVPANEKQTDREGLKRISKTYARDARMVGYLKDGKEKASGFGDTLIEEVDLPHLTPLLRTLNHPSRIRLISAARKIIAYAKAHGLWPKGRPSPFAEIDFAHGFTKHKEEHRPAITDPTKFGQLLRKMAVYEGRGDNLTGYALELLALTFVRPGTVASARWAHFNLTDAMWVVPFKRLKMATERSEAGKSEDDYMIPLSRQAAAPVVEIGATALGMIRGPGEVSPTRVNKPFIARRADHAGA